MKKDTVTKEMQVTTVIVANVWICLVVSHQEVRVGLTGLVCSALQTCGQYIAEVSQRGIISMTGEECMQRLSFILWRAGSFHIW